MRTRLSCLRVQVTSLSSLYTSGQCFLSVLGSIGVILLFAGIPQIIYSAKVNATNLLTFILGALLVTLMVAGNAFIGHKYRQLIRSRREQDRPHRNEAALRDDKPPSYDELVKQDGLPPEYEAAILDKPPIYSELVHEVINWEAISAYPYEATCTSESCKSHQEAPILAPVHTEIERLRSTSSAGCGVKRDGRRKGKTKSENERKDPTKASSQSTSSHVSTQQASVSTIVPSMEQISTEGREDGMVNDFVEIHFHDEETYF